MDLSACFTAGIRTGYCGSLTTFASWQLELMTAAINHNQWLNAMVGFLVGLFAAIASYVIGCHFALLSDRWARVADPGGAPGEPPGGGLRGSAG